MNRHAISTIVTAQNFRLVLKSEEKVPAGDSVKNSLGCARPSVIGSTALLSAPGRWVRKPSNSNYTSQTSSVRIKY
jgi:hypothetical protein